MSFDQSFDFIGPPRPPRKLGKHIIAEVAAEHGVAVSDILSPSRKKVHAKPRQIAMRRVRAELGYPFLKMARLFNRDHSTCIWAVYGKSGKRIREKAEAERSQAAARDQEAWERIGGQLEDAA